jgi:murein DD-endopeptidase MepM/ murein hydrolase activator NlpD
MGRIKYDDKKPFIKNKLFYLAMLGCLVALGISSYSAVSRMSPSDTSSVPSAPESQAIVSQVDKPVSDVPYPKEELPQSPTDSTEAETAPTQTAPYFLLPLGGEIIKDFDKDNLQYSETFKDWRLHLGVDIAARQGDAVVSSAAGVVEDIYEDPQLGMVVAVDHGGGLLLFYCGLNQAPTVKIGETVKAGTQLGAVDTIPSESVEQPHLHLAAEQDGQPVSPLVIMGLMN